MSKRSSTTSPQRTPRAAPHFLIRQKLVVGFVIVCMLALLVFVVRSSTPSAGSRVDRADVTNVRLVEQGRQLYTTRCAGCHGSDLGGEQGWPQRRANGVMPAAPLDERGVTWQHADQWIFTTIKDGGQATAPAGTISYMPAFGGGLTDAEIWSVISYIKSTWPESLQAQQPQPNE